jgi:tetratricopeptide (TPR) repeat protein
MRSILPLTAITLSLSLATAALAQPMQHPAPPQPESTREGAPLFDNLGSHTHRITTSSPQAQRYFDQGLTLAFAFNHAEAIRSFKEAARLDPRCAMAWWGIAYALGPNINAPMMGDAPRQAWEAVQKAKQLAPNISEKERAYIAAIEKRYAEDGPEDRVHLDKAWMEAMRDLHRRYPNDLDAATIYAESIMDTRPWNYWTKDKQPHEGTLEVLRALEYVMERDPNHPGALHLYIHATEAGPEPHKALAAADRLRDLIPGAGHLVHMPAHTYLRLGLYHEAVVANQRAIAADRSYIAACNAQGFYPTVYYSHNIHFLWYALAMEGCSRDAVNAAQEAAAALTPDQVREVPPMEWILATPRFAWTRFGMWDDVLAQPEPDSEFLFLLAMHHYTRGVAFAARDDLSRAQKELDALERLMADEDIERLEMDAFYGASQIRLARDVLEAAIAGQSGDQQRQVQLLRAAIDKQDNLPYMEPPYWYYPVRQSLGAALLEAGRFQEAEAVYREDLEVHPHNGWSLFGLRQALRGQGRDDAAAEVNRQLHLAWIRADRPPAARPF